MDTREQGLRTLERPVRDEEADGSYSTAADTSDSEQ